MISSGVYRLLGMTLTSLVTVQSHIHPGPDLPGQVSAGIAEDSLKSSRTVLRDFGNMSSATIMFVLKDIIRQGQGRGCGLAFGPGLTVESLLFQQAA